MLIEIFFGFTQYYFFSELENAKVRILENLKKSSLMLDEQDKCCTVKLDEFLTEIQISAVGKQSKISLDNLQSANILTKVCCIYIFIKKRLK